MIYNDGTAIIIFWGAENLKPRSIVRVTSVRVLALYPGPSRGIKLTLRTSDLSSDT